MRVDGMCYRNAHAGKSSGNNAVTVVGYRLGVYALPRLIRVVGHNREGGVAWVVVA